MGGFVITTVYGFSRPTGDLDVLEIAPRDAGRVMLELGMRDGALHRKYKIYLDHVGVAERRPTEPLILAVALVCDDIFRFLSA
jgi:hypothetical protein